MWSDIEPSGQEAELTFIEQARRKQIVDVTIEVLAEVGYGKASLALIAKRAGISKGVISYHFKNKDNLLAEVEAEIDRDLREVIRPRIEAQTTARGMLHAFIRSYLEYVRDHRSRLLALIEIYFLNARSTGHRPDQESFGYEEVYQGIEGMLSHGQHQDEFREFDTRVMAIALWGAIEGISTQWAANPDLDMDHYIDEAIVLMDQAILKAEERDAPTTL